MEDQLPEHTERGVKNPRVIDLISAGPHEDEVAFIMIEERPWGADEEQLDQLQEKFNNYLDYILDGFFQDQYPQYQGKRVRIELQCLEPPSPMVQSLLDAMSRYLQSVDLPFAVSIQSPLNF